MFSKLIEPLRKQLHKDPSLMRQKDWERMFKEFLPKATKPEHLTRAAILMESYDQARLWLFMELRKKNISIISPSIRIVQSGSHAKILGCLPTGKIHIIGQEVLLEDCKNDPCKILEFEFILDRKTLFIGTTAEYYALTAIEEMAHAAFLQIKSKHKQSKPTAATYARSLAEYDAHELEFRSLLWRLKYAQEHHFSQETIHVLIERIQNAKEFKRRFLV